MVEQLDVRAVPPVGLDEIRAARGALGGVARVTPVVESRVLSELCAGPVLLKCENLQRTGSFKIRGAYHRISRLDAGQRAGGVVAASAGNHAQGVALAAQLLGIHATVFMPERAALPKVGATRGYGAEVHLVGETIEGSIAAAVEHAARTGAVFVHPFDHPDIIAGQGTVGLEVLEQVPEAASVLVCTGGGGLLGGIAAAVKGVRPDVRVVGVQATGAAAWPASLEAGEPRALARMRTIADGIAVGRPGDVTFAQVSTLVDEIVTVDDDALSRALLLCLERQKMLVEPAGAAAVAALMEHPHRFPTPAVAVLSGGNIDPLVLLHLIQNGMAAASRYLSLRLRVADLPGALAQLLALVGTLGANVVDVAHSRITEALPLGQVEVALAVETRGREHSTDIVAALRGAGHAVSVVAAADGGS